MLNCGQKPLNHAPYRCEVTQPLARNLVELRRPTRNVFERKETCE
jgi:hypothetical protein